MSASLSGLNDFPSLRRWLKDYCEKKGYDCWHDYGPADLEKYRSDPVKILLMNSESVECYDKCIPPDAYLEWIKNGEKTPRYGSVLVTFIREYISLLWEQKPIPPFDQSSASKLFQDVVCLLNNMRGTIYMNASIRTNDTGTSAEDKARVRSDAVEFAPYRKRLVEILRPGIIICGGESAKNGLFLEGGAFEQSAWKNESLFEAEDFTIVSTGHLGRPNVFGGYENLHQIASDCAAAYVQKKLRGV
jgi:hypothetical protein